MKFFAVSVQHPVSVGLLAVFLLPTASRAMEPLRGVGQDLPIPAKFIEAPPVSFQTTSPNGQSRSPQSPNGTSQQNTGTQPLGTAAAPEIKSGGISASTPSGAVISPGKQKRAHIFTLKTALIVGAVVAVGIVIGASASSPGRP